jgi:predicted phage-related endonuclease
MDVYASKLGLLEDKADNDAMARGRFLEQGILNWFYDRTGLSSAKPNKAVVKHPKFEFLGGNPDDIAKGKGGKLEVVEVKTVGVHSAHQWGPEGTDEVPPYYMCQATWYAGLLKIPSWYLVAYIEGREGIQIYPNETDWDLFEQLVELGVDFWKQHVETQTPPPVDGSDSCKRLLAQLHPKDTGEIIAAPEDLLPHIAELYQVKQQSNELYKKQLELENLIKANMKDASLMEARGWSKPFSWKCREDSKKTDYQAVAVSLAEMYSVGDDLMMRLVEKNTAVVPGPRVFNAPWSREKKEA